MTQRHFLFLIFLLLLNCIAPCTAQQKKPSIPLTGMDLPELSDRYYGSDDLLVSGSVYIPANPLIDRHPFFEQEEWFEGTVFIDGRRFDNQEISYDLVANRMILNAVFKEGATVRIVLNSWKIDSLFLGDHFFINSKHLAPGQSDTTFYEVINRDGFTFISEYRKEYIQKYTASTPYGLWSQQLSHHYIFTGQWHPIFSKKSLLTFFPSGKDEIRRFMHKNQIKYRKATSRQIKLLIAHCSQYFQPES